MGPSRLLELTLARRDALSDEDRRALHGIAVRKASFRDGETVIARGPTPEESCLLVSGMASRSHPAPDGARVVTALHVPGDFVDLHGLLLERLDHDIIAIGDVRVEFVPAEDLRRVSRTAPHLTRLLWLMTLIDASTHRAWIVARTSLDARLRIGHLFSELYVRLSAVGLVDNRSFAMPLGQKGLAEVLGYSAVHVNRAVQALRAENLLHWSGGTVRLPDPEALATICSFDPAYLEIERAPR